MSSSVGTLAKPFTSASARRIVGHLERAADVEPHDDLVGVHAAGALAERRVGRAANQLARDRLTADQLTFVLELDLAGDRRQRRVDVGDARHDLRLAGAHRAPLGVRDDVLHHRDRHALRHARAPVDALVGPRLERDALDHLAR